MRLKERQKDDRVTAEPQRLATFEALGHLCHLLDNVANPPSCNSNLRDASTPLAKEALNVTWIIR